MVRVTRESRLNAAFVAVADTLTADYDVVDLLHTLVTECTEILDAQAGGLLLSEHPGGRLQLLASTSEDAELVELMQLAAGQGPCLDCFLSGDAVDVADIGAARDRWPEFAAVALDHGFRSVHATAMRLRGEIIGTMNLFRTRSGAFPERDAAVAQALADVATIGILHERTASRSQIVVEQLQRALDSRVLIEQAKGVLAQAVGLSMDAAFDALRRYARQHSVPLRMVAASVVERSLDLAMLVEG
jgi:GAF domain-containing protein